MILIIQKIFNMAFSNCNTPNHSSIQTIAKKLLLHEARSSGCCRSQVGAGRLMEETDVPRKNACSVICAVTGCVGSTDKRLTLPGRVVLKAF